MPERARVSWSEPYCTRMIVTERARDRTRVGQSEQEWASVAEVGRLSANAKKSLQLFRWARICKFATKTFFCAYYQNRNFCHPVYWNDRWADSVDPKLSQSKRVGHNFKPDVSLSARGWQRLTRRPRVVTKMTGAESEKAKTFWIARFLVQKFSG